LLNFFTLFAEPIQLNVQQGVQHWLSRTRIGHTATMKRHAQTKQ